ncbi:hypothetical protein ABK040_005914 [Willaertia magna]
MEESGISPIFYFSEKTEFQLLKLEKTCNTQEEKDIYFKVENYIINEFKNISKFKEQLQFVNLSEILNNSNGSFNEEIINIVKSYPNGDLGLVIDTFCILRFCIARKYQYQAIINLMTEFLDWRLEKKPQLLKSEPLKKELMSGKAFWCGKDKENSPTITINPQHHISYDRVLEESLDYTLFLGEYGMNEIFKFNQLEIYPKIEKKELTLEEGLNQLIEQYVILYDGRFVAMKNFDIPVIKEFLRYANYYAERLKVVYIYKPSWSYYILWKSVSPFLDKKTTSKIVMVNDWKEVEDKIDIHQVPKDLD